MAKARDYYDVLGVSRGATSDQIRSAYRKLARQHHPDVNKAPEAAKNFAEVQEAYDVLSDAEKRKAYDRFGHAGVGSGAAGAGPGAGPAGWGGFGGPGRTVWTSSHGGGMGAEDLSDVFEEIFGGRGAGAATGRGPRRATSPFDFANQREAARGAGAPPSQRGQDVEHTLSVTFMTAALGGTEQLRFTGDGSASTISVKIPPGIDAGAKLRIKGKGRPSPFGGQPGDLILNIEVGKHPYFRREGMDVLIDVPINIAEAVQGVTVKVPLLSSDAEGPGFVLIKVPPGASGGRKLRVRGKGIKDGSGKTGDYFAVIQVVAPAPSDLSATVNEAIATIGPELKNPRESAPYADAVKDRPL